MKITFISYHNWDTKRIGGFHKLAEYASNAGHDVVFFSFARPYYIALKKDERLNKSVLKELSKGCIYNLDRGKIVNCTWPTLDIPGPLKKIFPESIDHKLGLRSFRSFSKFYKKYLLGTDVFVFESCDGIRLFDKIKAMNPKAKFIYRPSDPIMIPGCSRHDRESEEHILKNVDLNLIVNQAGLDLYKSCIPNFDNVVRYQILPNGVDVSAFKKSYSRPQIFSDKINAVYVGAIRVEWNLVIEAAKAIPEIQFIIVCPQVAPEFFLNNKPNNVVYIPGIKPSQVPEYVTNADIIIVPNPKGEFALRPWGITAKYYQAMAAGKPIVSFSDTKELEKYGVSVAYTYDDFIINLHNTLKSQESRTYNYKTYDWSELGKKFIDSIQSL